MTGLSPGAPTPPVRRVVTMCDPNWENLRLPYVAFAAFLATGENAVSCVGTMGVTGMKLYTGATLLSVMLLCCWPAPAADNGNTWKPKMPKVWDDAALADWPTPVAGLNVRPTHNPSKKYYSLTVDNLRTYPVYFPGREPEG